MTMDMYWNHNSAYYPWIKRKTADCHSVLDVECGDGSLALFLNDGTKEIVGIDTDRRSIEKAVSGKKGDSVEFLCCSFEDFPADRTFDAVIFSASIPAKYTGEVTEIVNGPAKPLIVLDGRTIINLDYVQVIELLD